MLRDTILEIAHDMKITLNGKPATISGRCLKFLHVVCLNEPLGCEFSDSAIYNVLTTKNGHFTT